MGSLFDYEKKPLICVPITAKTEAELKRQLAEVIKTAPHMIEWRADFFEQLPNFQAVIQMVNMIKKTTEIPLLFTIRSEKEGGERIDLAEAEKVELLQMICQETSIDLIDYEVENDRSFVTLIHNSAKENGVELILSYHNFSKTPKSEQLIEIAKKMEGSGAHVAKLAVMPRTQSDVTRLLDITSQIDALLSIPVITMSMGELGVISRIIGWAYGSQLTFAVGVESSAPGQVPVHKLKKAIEAVQSITNG